VCLNGLLVCWLRAKLAKPKAAAYVAAPFENGSWLASLLQQGLLLTDIEMKKAEALLSGDLKC
jgi:hypothetical protein